MRKLGFIVLGSFVFLLLVIITVLVFYPPYADKQRNPITVHNPYIISLQAQALHGSLIVGDLHGDALLWSRNLNKRNSRGHIDIPRLVEGNVALQVFTAVTKVPSKQNYKKNSANTFDNIKLLAVLSVWPPRTWGSLFERALHQLNKLKKFEKKSKGKLSIIRTKTDLEKIILRKKNGESIVGGLFGVEGGHAFEGKIKNLENLYGKGLRVVGLHHFFDNELGGSLHGVSKGGLTGFGRQVIKFIEEKGMVLDLAHSSKKVIKETLDSVDFPVIISHTGVHSHTPISRNVDDKLLLRIARGGGLIGVGFWPQVIGADHSPTGIAKVIIHAAKRFGVNHIALGSDFDGNVRTSLDASELAAVTQALLKLGMAESEIRKVMGENMLRLLHARLK